MSADGPPDESTTAAVTTGLGLVGGLLSVLLGPTDLSRWQKLGCVIAGGSCAFVGAPLVTVAFPAAGPRVISLAGFVLGLSGLFLVRGLTAWMSRFEQQIPDEIDRRAGLDTRPKLPPPASPPVSSPVPPAPASPPSPGKEPQS